MSITHTPFQGNSPSTAPVGYPLLYHMVTRGRQESWFTALPEYCDVAHKQGTGPIWFCLLDWEPGACWESGTGLSRGCGWQSLGGVRGGVLAASVAAQVRWWASSGGGKQAGLWELLHCFIQPWKMSTYSASDTQAGAGDTSREQTQENPSPHGADGFGGKHETTKKNKKYILDSDTCWKV